MLLRLLTACAELPDGAVHRPRDPVSYHEAWEQLAFEVEGHVQDDGVPAVAVAVVIDGRLAYAEGFGSADADTVFRWASVSKPHTALAASILANRGLLSLDDRVVDWLPDFRPDPSGWPADALTVEQLVLHTGGVPTDLPWSCDTDDAYLVDFFDQAQDWPLWSEPGAVHNYSNTGYGLLGAVLQQASGQAFPELMQAVVLQPAGLRTATFRPEEAVEFAHEDGHVERDVTVVLEDWDCARTRPASMLHGSVHDLGRMVELLVTDGRGVAPPEFLERMGQDRDTRWRGDGSHRAGMGFFGLPFEGVDIVTHDGYAHGFDAELTLVPDRRFGVAVVANASWASAYGVRVRALELFLGLDPLITPQPTLTPPSDWGRHEGIYEQPWDLGPEHARRTYITVAVDGDRLLARFDRTGVVVELVQTDGDAFAYALDGATWPIRLVDGWWVHRNYVARRLAD